MSDRPRDNFAGLDIDMARQIDVVCRRFEAEWRAGCQPHVEDYLLDVSDEGRPALGAELEGLERELCATQEAGVATEGRTSPAPDPGTTPPPAITDAPSNAPGAPSSVPDSGEARASVHEDATIPPDRDPTIDLTPVDHHMPATAEGQAAQAGPDVSEPVRVRYFGDYEIVREIARGGMGVVFQARQISLNRPVALKMILTGQLANETEVKRFYTEAEAAANLDHPGIVPIYEVGQHEGQHYFSMGFVQGQSLSQRLAGGPLPAREAAELMRRVSSAIEYAHRRGVIHRDLKPANILLDQIGNPRVTDFGLAKKLQCDSGLTGSGQVVGTPSYMPPEQAGGERGAVGPAADVYSLGATLYALLTGRPPFQAATAMDTLLMVISDEPVPLRRLNGSVPLDLETICLKCLEKEPGKRYASAAALVEDLRRFLAGEPIKARRTPLWERTLKLARRHPVAATLLTLGLIATVSLGGAWMRFTWLKQQGELRKSLLVADRKGSVLRSLLQAQDLLREEKWSDAEVGLSKAQAEIRNEPELRDLALRTGELLENAQRGRAVQENRSHDQERLRTFRERRRDALFHETRFTGLDLPYNPETVRTSARAAVSVFIAEGAGESSGLKPLPESLSPREHDEIKEGCYELLLFLAEAEPSPDLGLRLLDQAARLEPETRAYHLRRADCLARRGDAKAADVERRTAEALPFVSALDHFLIGKELYKRGDWAGALPHFDRALLLQPGHFWAHCLSAICSLQRRRPEPAKAELTACLQAEPNFAWLYELRGFASYQIATLARTAVESLQARGGTLLTEAQLQLQAAEADYAQALELLGAAPNHDLRYPLLVNRGLLWLERREWDKAERDLQAAIRLDDHLWQAFETLAHVYQKQDKPDQAIGQFTCAIRLRPDWAPLYRARAAVNLDRKDQGPTHRSQALADLEQAIRLEPPGSPVLALDHTSRARVLHQEMREEESLAACEVALRVEPNYLDAHRLRIEVLRKLNRYDAVIRSCDVVLALGKPSAGLYEIRGLAKEKLRDYEGAIEDQTLAIALHPGTAPGLARRGALYLVTDAPRSALRDFEHAIRLDPSNADVYLGRGLAFAALGQHRAAVADAAKALGMAEPTRTRLYNSARIHAQATIAAANEARKTGREAVSLTAHYQEQAIRLLSEWFKRLPPADRSSSLRAAQEDPAMATVRRRLRSLELGGLVFSSGSSASQRRP